MTNSIDIYVGRRLRRRRRLLGLTQANLGEQVGIRFQQIQKYECAANRISASRLFDLSEALHVPVQYFYDGLNAKDPANDTGALPSDILSQRETMELVRAYYSLNEEPRRRLLDLAKAMGKPE
ncbi:Transcriptional regulator, Xre family [hydrothermal vent metagenome]|uniref:Transcriptional regulator, Xre family n=1 Tax=hydrothermal vent metagenome TaxID=652676 RepID=A0A3B0S2K7_9ZZZZ